MTDEELAALEAELWGPLPLYPAEVPEHLVDDVPDDFAW